MKWLIDIKMKLKGGEKYRWIVVIVLWAIMAVVVSRLAYELYGSYEISIIVWLYFLIYAVIKL